MIFESLDDTGSEPEETVDVPLPSPARQFLRRRNRRLQRLRRPLKNAVHNPSLQRHLRLHLAAAQNHVAHCSGVELAANHGHHTLRNVKAQVELTNMELGRLRDQKYLCYML